MIDTSVILMLLPVIILQLIFSLFCIIKIYKGNVKYLPKWLWILLCLGTVGCIIYLIIGKGDE